MGSERKMDLPRSPGVSVAEEGPDTRFSLRFWTPFIDIIAHMKLRPTVWALNWLG